MFTGIIEYTGKVTGIRTSGTNKTFELEVPFDEPVRIDQSIAHNGICLTVTEIFSQSEGASTHYAVTAVEETLLKTHAGDWQVGTLVNIERCLKAGDRLDGHFVQGHVDDVARVTRVEDRDGSWNYEFQIDRRHQTLLVDKGSVCVNGVSLTVVKAWEDRFTVTIIPYTYHHTNFASLKPGDRVNLEFDILGKYLRKLVETRAG